MNLHENIELFKDAIVKTAQEKGIPEIYIEKDYWVTVALHTIFHSEIGSETVFKGGTALSKCYKLIDRFSEDIDLVLLQKEEQSGNKLKKKLKLISECVNNTIPEVEVEGITNKMGMIRKTAHSYNKVFKGNFGQVRDIIVIESSWLGNFEPYTEQQVSSFIYEMMINNGQEEIAKKYSLEPFEVKALSIERTLCEKIMSLVRFSYSANPIEDLQNKVRHVYDLYMILKEEKYNSFFQSDDFISMLKKVAKDDLISFKNNNDWLKHHPSKALIFSDTKNIWSKIKGAYENSFRELVIGNIPESNQVLETLIGIQKRLEGISQ